ncbi:hypothetical protein NDU88_004279 [Pleurodeles waltl]|uniref:Uncharacterized protein n=1 Tax=Pleurodeles waltl TaxID=8319 RepID=A0AAV7V0T7_PLEWA|nr:hypothetical protein NDU88_004279 [Pleurodeles waltl]
MCRDTKVGLDLQTWAAVLTDLLDPPATDRMREEDSTNPHAVGASTIWTAAECLEHVGPHEKKEGGPAVGPPGGRGGSKQPPVTAAEPRVQAGRLANTCLVPERRGEGSGRSKGAYGRPQ